MSPGEKTKARRDCDLPSVCDHPGAGAGRRHRRRPWSRVKNSSAKEAPSVSSYLCLSRTESPNGRHVPAAEGASDTTVKSRVPRERAVPVTILLQSCRRRQGEEHSASAAVSNAPRHLFVPVFQLRESPPRSQSCSPADEGQARTAGIKHLASRCARF